MSVEKLVSELIELGVRLETEGGQLRVTGLRPEQAPAFLPRLKEHKEELLQYLQSLRRKKNLPFTRIEPVPPAASYALSSAQFRLWVLSQFAGGSVAYNMPMTIDLDEHCDPAALDRALRAVIARHESLRTIFKADAQGDVRQWVLPPDQTGFALTVLDYRPQTDPAEAVRHFLETDAAAPFDLARGPLLRASLLQLDDQRYVLSLILHHIIGDGWSLEVLLREALLFYQAYKEKRPVALPPLPFQYKDYVAWQSSWLTDEKLKNSRQFWLRQLSGTLPLLQLPGSKTRPPLKTYHGQSVETLLGPETVQALSRFCTEQGGTLFMGLAAAVNALFYHYTQERDFILGTPVAGREHPDLEGQIGLYINMVALRNTVEPEEGFQALFQRVRTSVLASFEHQHFPFHQLVEDLHLKKDLSRNAVFDCLLALQNVGENDPDRLPAADLSEHAVKRNEFAQSKYDLEFIFEEVGRHLYLGLVFNADVYDFGRMERLIGHFKNLLAGVLQNPSLPIREIELLSPAEERQLLAFATDGVLPHAAEQSLTDLFNRQVRDRPDAVALKIGDQDFTYRELHALADPFSGYLIEAYGVRPADFVAIQLGRSEWMVVAILAILQAGAAYVPIDPTFPAERIDYIRNDSQCRLVVDDLVVAAFKALTDKRMSIPKPVVSAASAAYVMYTSGSTGQPKGVVVEHRNATALFAVMDAQFSFAGCRLMAGITNYTFDLSIVEILGSLCTGRTIVLFSEAETADPEKLKDKLDREGVQLIQLTPTRLLQLGDDFYTRNFRDLRVILVGGEGMREEQYQRLKALRGVKSYNCYGPTETTVWSTCSEIGPSDRLCLGRPLLNEYIYVLNSSDRLVPIGLPGEVCLGGEGVSRGYLHRPELTAQKFIDDPFRPGERIYRSGDLAYWAADGQLCFVGRVDDQVKVRGYRIELDEIENTLLRIPGVRQAAVLVKKDEAGEAYLVGYFAAAEPIPPADVKAFLKTVLPEYMLPARLLQLETLPMTSNGKVNKKILPPVEVRSTERYVAPETELERQLARIWADVLQVEQVGMEDDFFELGGQSIKLIRLLNRYGQEFNVRPSVDLLYKNPLLSQHAGFLTDGMHPAAPDGLLAFGEFEPRKSTLILIPPVTGSPLVYNTFARTMADRYNCFGLTYPGADFTGTPLSTIGELARFFRDVLLEQGFGPDRPLRLLGYSMGAAIAFELVKLLEEQRFSCELVLIDQAPNDGSAAGLEAWTDDDEQYFMDLVAANYGQLEAQEAESVKRFLKHNLSVLSAYRTQGKIRANLLGIQGSAQEEMDMRQWNKFTTGNCETKFLNIDHYALFDDGNIAALTEIIESADHAYAMERQDR